MDKTMLLMMLAQQAPALLRMLKRNADTDNMGINPIGALEVAMSRQYDLPSLEEQALQNEKEGFPGMPLDIMPDFETNEGGIINKYGGQPKISSSGFGDVFPYMVSNRTGFGDLTEDEMRKVLLSKELQDQAPMLNEALIMSDGGLKEFPNIKNAIMSGADLPLMNSRMSNPSESQLRNLNHLYNSPETFGNSESFPSDGNSQLDLQTLSERLLKDPNNVIGDNGQPALMSAAVFQNNPDQMIVPESSNITEIDGVPYSDSDLDDIHSNEMWDNGYGYQHPLKDWYKKHKR